MPKEKRLGVRSRTMMHKPYKDQKQWVCMTTELTQKEKNLETLHAIFSLDVVYECKGLYSVNTKIDKKYGGCFSRKELREIRMAGFVILQITTIGSITSLLLEKET
jgi:hypothetical protein